jgi:segregation and condensation protein B
MRRMADAPPAEPAISTTSTSLPAPRVAVSPAGAQAVATVPPERLAAAVEALVLSSDRALSPAKLAAAMGLDEKGATASIKAAVEELNSQYESSGRAFRIEQVAGGYRAVALAEFAPQLAALHGVRESHALSKAAVETLAIIAYRQPITRASLEAIRGVNCGEVLRSLLEKRLVDITGRAEEPGRPMLYGTTKRFLDEFGLSSLKDLPSHTDFAPPTGA